MPKEDGERMRARTGRPISINFSAGRVPPRASFGSGELNAHLKGELCLNE